MGKDVLPYCHYRDVVGCTVHLLRARHSYEIDLDSYKLLLSAFCVGGPVEMLLADAALLGHSSSSFYIAVNLLAMAWLSTGTQLEYTYSQRHRLEVRPRGQDIRRALNRAYLVYHNLLLHPLYSSAALHTAY